MINTKFAFSFMETTYQMMNYELLLWNVPNLNIEISDEKLINFRKKVILGAHISLVQGWSLITLFYKLSQVKFGQSVINIINFTLPIVYT